MKRTGLTASNAIEGNTLTLCETAEVIETAQQHRLIADRCLAELRHVDYN